VCPRAGLEGRKISSPTGIRSLDRSARSQSLYRQSYPAYELLKEAHELLKEAHEQLKEAHENIREKEGVWILYCSRILDIS